MGFCCFICKNKKKFNSLIKFLCFQLGCANLYLSPSCLSCANLSCPRTHQKEKCLRIKRSQVQRQLEFFSCSLLPYICTSSFLRNKSGNWHFGISYYTTLLLLSFGLYRPQSGFRFCGFFWKEKISFRGLSKQTGKLTCRSLVVTLLRGIFFPANAKTWYWISSFEKLRKATRSRRRWLPGNSHQLVQLVDRSQAAAPRLSKWNVEKGLDSPRRNRKRSSKGSSWSADTQPKGRSHTRTRS